MDDYQLIEPNGTIHLMEFENIVDLSCATRLHSEIRDIIWKECNKKGSYTKRGRLIEAAKARLQRKIFNVVTSSHLGECLPDTIKRINKVNVPSTDY